MKTVKALALLFGIAASTVGIVVGITQLMDRAERRREPPLKELTAILIAAPFSLPPIISAGTNASPLSVQPFSSLWTLWMTNSGQSDLKDVKIYCSDDSPNPVARLEISHGLKTNFYGEHTRLISIGDMGPHQTALLQYWNSNPYNCLEPRKPTSAISIVFAGGVGKVATIMTALETKPASFAQSLFRILWMPIASGILFVTLFILATKLIRTGLRKNP